MKEAAARVQFDGVRHGGAGLWQQIFVYDVVVEVAGNHGREGFELQLEGKQAAAELWRHVVHFENVMHCAVPGKQLRGGGGCSPTELLVWL